MAKKKEDKKLTKDQAEKKIFSLKKDLFNIRFKKGDKVSIIESKPFSKNKKFQVLENNK